MNHLGTLAHYSNGTMISQIERGIKDPSPEKLADIAEALGVSVADLYGEADGRAVTNYANGNQVVYQHVEELSLMTDEFQVILRKVVEEVVDARCEKLLAEVKVALREAAREADDGGPSSAPEG